MRILFHLSTATCSGQWIGSNDQCHCLINGTNKNWVKISSSTKDWCTSFRSCLSSRSLQNRCRKDFNFYDSFFSRTKAFLFEIGSYIPSTRIQVRYGCARSYRLEVNIIRCDSGSGATNIITGEYLLIIRELKQPRRRRQQESHEFAFLTMKNNSFARFAGAFFILGHFADVLDLSTT